MAITKVKDRYDCTDEMTEDKKNFIKMCARLEGDVRFIREDWKCDKHGDFYVLGLEGRPFPTAECANCKREKKIIEDSEEAIAKAYLPSSGLFRSQYKLDLKNFSGDKAAIAKNFISDPTQIFLLFDNAKHTDSLLAYAMVVYVCRGGRQGQIVTMYQLTCRIQASWKGRKTTEDLLNEMTSFPFLVIDEIEELNEDWAKKFIIGLLTARTVLKKKTVLIAEGEVKSLIPQKAFSKVFTKEAIVKFTEENKLFYSPPLEEVEMESKAKAPEDDNDGIPL